MAISQASEEKMSLNSKSLDSNHEQRAAKVLQQVQESLKKQLIEKKNALDDRIYEQKGQLVRATKDREEVGVQLYDLQCNLSSVYASLNKASSTLVVAAEAHTKVKSKFDDAQKCWNLRSEEQKNLTKRRDEAREELDGILNTIKTAQKILEKLKGDVVASKRATYIVEEGMVAIEALKRKQDIAVDECQERIKELQKNVEIAKIQLEAQKNESKISSVALHEADVKMDAIHYEKRQLTFQWNSTLLVLIRCDHAIKILRLAMHQQAESKRVILAEKERYIKDIAKQTKKNEEAKFILLRILRDVKKTQKQLDFVKPRLIIVLHHNAETLAEVEIVVAQIKKVEREITKLQSELKKIDIQYKKETTKIHELENQILIELLGKAKLGENEAKATVASIRELQKAVKEEDALIVDLYQKLSLFHNDIFTLQAHNQDVAFTLQSVNEDVALKYNLISKLDKQIHKREQEVEIKTKEIMHLNRRLEQATAHFEDPNASSPTEALVYSLRQEISQRIKDSNESQKRWLALQTSLVLLQKDVNALSEKVQREAYNQGVLMQRKYRVDLQYNVLQKAIHTLQVDIRKRQNLVNRLNDLIRKNKNLESSLIEVTKNMQFDHYTALKDLASETIELQSRLNNSLAEKDHAIKHLDELEHHVMLWRYKISFETKTQASVDPKIGSNEVAILRRGIFQMQYELDTLTVQQKKLINDLESKVDIRKTITIKMEGECNRRGIEGPTAFEAGLVRAAKNLKAVLQNTYNKFVESEKRMISLKLDKNASSEKVLALDEKLDLALAQQKNLMERLKVVVSARSRAFLSTAMYQDLSKKYENVKSNKWKGVFVKKSIDDDIQDAHAKGIKLIKVINELKKQLPSMEQKLESLLIQIGLALDAPR